MSKNPGSNASTKPSSLRRLLNARSIGLVLLFVTGLLSLAVLSEEPTLIRSVSAHPEASPEPTPTPTAEELALEEQKRLLDLKKGIAVDKKDIAEAEKAQMEARFPSADTKPLAGETKVDGAVIESQMVAYYQMAQVADLMIAQVKSVKPDVTTLAIYNQSDVNLQLSYKTTSAQLELIKKGYQNLLVEPVPNCTSKTVPEGLDVTTFDAKIAGAVLAPKIIESFVGAFVDMTALLRTNVEIKGQTFDLDQTALVSEVFRAAHGKNGISNVILYYPEAFPPKLDSVTGTGSPLLALLDALNVRRAYTEKLIKALDDNDKEIKKTEAELKKLKADAKDLKERIKVAEEDLARLEAVYGKLGGGRRIPPAIHERMLKLGDEIGHLKDSLSKLEDPLTGKIVEVTNKLSQLKSQQVCLFSKLAPQLRDPDILEDTFAKLRGQNEQFTKFLEALLKVDTTSAMNPLTSYIKAEMLLEALKGNGSYWLQLKVLKAGGNNRIKTNLIADIVRGGNRLSHSGGAIVEYILFNKDGQVIKSDAFTAYSKYMKASEIQKLPNP